MIYRKLKETVASDARKTTALISSPSIPMVVNIDALSGRMWFTSQAGISVAAGVIASLVTQPADVIKTYRQVAPGDYRNVYVTIKAIIRVRSLLQLHDGSNDCFL